MKKKPPSEVRVFEKRNPKGFLMLYTKDDERVAYLTPDGWLLLDDSGYAVAKTREQAQQFVTGALGPARPRPPEKKKKAP